MTNQRVNRTFPIKGSEDRIVLLSWSADPEPRKHNVRRVDRLGSIVWEAELPGKAASDCFISLVRDGDEFIARTYSEYAIRLDANGGAREISRDMIST